MLMLSVKKALYFLLIPEKTSEELLNKKHTLSFPNFVICSSTRFYIRFSLPSHLYKRLSFVDNTVSTLSYLQFRISHKYFISNLECTSEDAIDWLRNNILIVNPSKFQSIVKLSLIIVKLIISPKSLISLEKRRFSV